MYIGNGYTCEVSKVRLFLHKCTKRGRPGYRRFNTLTVNYSNVPGSSPAGTFVACRPPSLSTFISYHLCTADSLIKRNKMPQNYLITVKCKESEHWRSSLGWRPVLKPRHFFQLFEPDVQRVQKFHLFQVFCLRIGVNQPLKKKHHFRKFLMLLCFAQLYFQLVLLNV